MTSRPIDRPMTPTDPPPASVDDHRARAAARGGLWRPATALLLFGLSFGYVAASMIATGLVVLASEAAGRPFRLTRPEWAMVFAGGAILVTAFCWDFRNVMAGGLPRPFHWPLFWLGQIAGLAGFASAWQRSV